MSKINCIFVQLFTQAPRGKEMPAKTGGLKDHKVR